MKTEEIVRSTRANAGLFRVDDRGLLEVKGEDRGRWLDGMISGDVSALEGAGVGAGCYATLLTNRGKIVADLHVANLGSTFLIECQRANAADVRATLDRFIIADDVELSDQSEAFEALSLEGPKADDVLCAVTTMSEAEVASLEINRWCETEVAGVAVRVGAFGWSGERAFQIFVPRAAAEGVAAAIAEGGAGAGLVLGDAASLEILRIESGTPQLGKELGENVLPPEARLERAIALNKGCYVGQEIVARLRARGQVNHLLVGLRFDADASKGGLPSFDAELRAGDRRTGEVKSVAQSPTEGAIGLAFVRREHADPGTQVEFEGGSATVSSLPFFPLPYASDSSESSESSEAAADSPAEAS